MTDPASNPLVRGVAAATLLQRYVFGGRGPETWDPMYPYHGAVRRCPFCREVYRMHGGFADHRDRCDEGPCPGANPVPRGDG